MGSPWDGHPVTSPVTAIVKRAIDQFALWSAQLQALGLPFEEGDAIPYWNLLSAIHVLTEEEGVPLRATDAYAFVGGSFTTGKRRLAALIRAGLVETRENPDRRTEKFVRVSARARQAVIATLDSWAKNYAADTAAYQAHRTAKKAWGASRSG